MKWTPKKHDRVRVYMESTAQGEPATKMSGKVVEIADNGDVRVHFDGVLGPGFAWFHPKQCRRLKPRAPSVRVTRRKLYDALAALGEIQGDDRGRLEWENLDEEERQGFNRLCTALGLPTEGAP